METKIVFQSQTKGCGYAAIKMALIHSSGRKDFAYAEEPKIGNRAPSVADLVKYASSLGLNLVAYKVNNPEDLKANTEYPLLIIIKENYLTHMVYLIKKTRRNYVFLDPVKGKRTMRHQELHDRFIGTFLCERGYRDIAGRFERKRALPLRHAVLDAVFSVLPSLLLLAGLFVLDLLPLWIGMTLIGGSMVAIAASRWHKLHQFKEFDRRYGSKLLSENPGERKNLYQHFCAYKSLAFTSLGGLFSSLLEYGLAFGVFAYRNVFFGLVLCFASLMSIAVEILDSPRQKKEEEKMEERENAFLSYAMSPEERKISLLSLFASSSSYAKTMLAKQAFMLGVSIGLGAIAMALTGIYDFESFVFYCLGTVLVLHALGNCFGKMDEVDRKRKEEPYFLFHFLD